MEKKEFLRQVNVNGQRLTIADIRLLQKKGLADIDRLPYSIRILVENLLRKFDGRIVREEVRQA